MTPDQKHQIDRINRLYGLTIDLAGLAYLNVLADKVEDIYGSRLNVARWALEHWPGSNLVDPLTMNAQLDFSRWESENTTQEY